MLLLADTVKEDLGWAPFRVAQGRAEKMRALNSPYGVGDRLRAVAFAEIQAREGFLWGARAFVEAPAEWRDTWLRFAEMENTHAQLLLNRAAELKVDLSERSVSDSLMRTFRRADRAEVFYYLISTAEQRGMEVGLSMIEPMREVDAESAAIFERCALEEKEHIAAALAALANHNLEAIKAEVLQKTRKPSTEVRA